MTALAIHHVLTLATCAAQLALCIVALSRVSQSPVAAPLASNGLVALVWTFADLAGDVTADPRWSYLDWSVSPWSPALGLHVVISFVGQRRRLRHLLALAYAASAVLSALSASAFFSAWGRDFAPSTQWELSMVALMAPNLALSLWLLARNLREQALQVERMRTQLLIAAFVSAFALGAVDVLLDPVVPVPDTLVSTTLATLAVLRFRLFGRGPTVLSVALGCGFVAIAGAVGAVAMTLASQSTALRATIGFATAVVVVTALTQLVRELLQRRARIDKLALLGRMTSQIGHDIKNPLAAMKGAAQFLKEERAQGRSIDEQQAFLDLIADEADRLGRLIDRYQRLRTLEPRRTPTDANALIAQVVSRLALRDAGTETRLELATDLPSCNLDPDLMSTALENLLVNAHQSLHGSGNVTVRTALLGRTRRHNALSITIADTGSGMNPRELEQAFDEFFTTKATGSGLGLPLVRRVVDAHGGSLHVNSQSGRGTDVTIELPLGARP